MITLVCFYACTIMLMMETNKDTDTNFTHTTPVHFNSVGYPVVAINP